MLKHLRLKPGFRRTKTPNGHNQLQPKTTSIAKIPAADDMV